MELVKQDNFNGYILDIFGERRTYFITRRQIGEALEYNHPQKAIDNIHMRHKDKLDKLSVTLNLRATDLKSYDTMLYNLNGVLLICRYSRQPKAEALTDKVYDIMFNALCAAQSQLARSVETIAELRSQNERLEAQFLEQHTQRKQLKEENKRLTEALKLEESPAGRAARDFLRALKTALDGEHAIVKASGRRKRVEGQIIGVYDREYLYMPPEIATEIYNMSTSQKLTEPQFVEYLRASGMMSHQETKRTIDGQKRRCVIFPLMEIERVGGVRHGKI